VSPPSCLRRVHRTGILRREVLQVGMLGAFGLSLADLLASRPAAGASGPRSGSKEPRAKGVILVWLSGGPPQMQFWDPKPDSPAECRGTAVPIKTRAPGVEIGHRLPLLAEQARHFGLVRSITLDAEDDNHILGNYKILGAIDKTPANFRTFASRDEWPSMGAVITRFRPSGNGLPTALSLPNKVLFQNQGVPGEPAGWLGSRYDPWHLHGDPNSPDFRVPDLLPLPGFTVDRLNNRRKLLDQVDGYRRDLDQDLSARQLSDAHQRAFAVTTSAATRQAFDLKEEPEKLRDRYGRHTWGQSLLLARRLVQAGVGFVQVNLGAGLGVWDYHQREDWYMDQHCPPFDRGLSALIEDMAQQGVLDETLVICMGEMGRNPILGRTVAGAAANAATPDGRNHWQWCWTGLFAGAGIRGGAVVGESDEWAGYVKTDPVFPSDIGATVFHCMGVPRMAEVRDLEDRPNFINNEGQVIDRLFA
jgi:hypothetical protein